nr:ABC transporter permease [Agrobacterium sp. T29]
MSTVRLFWYLASALLGVFLIILWDRAFNARLISPVFVPSPAQAFYALIDGWQTGDLAFLFRATLMRMIYGWLLASVVGVFLGALIGSSRWMQDYLGTTLEMLRPLPASAVIPVAIALFGLSDTMVLAVVAFGALWPVLLATVHGFQRVEPRLFEVARVFNMSRLEFAWKIALPGALPEILSGARLSLTASLAMAIAGEMLVGVDGVGQWMLAAGRSFRSAEIFAGLILLALIGITSSILLDLFDRWILKWRRLQH